MLDKLELKKDKGTDYVLSWKSNGKDKGTDYVLSWKSNGAYNSKLKPSYTAFLQRIKLSGYKTGIKFDNNPLAVEHYLT